VLDLTIELLTINKAPPTASNAPPTSLANDNTIELLEMIQLPAMMAIAPPLVSE
jgi:hypothetical protein